MKEQMVAFLNVMKETAGFCQGPIMFNQPVRSVRALDKLLG